MRAELQGNGAHHVGGGSIKTGTNQIAVLAGDMEAFAQAGADEAAGRREQRVVDAGIGPEAAFPTVIAGEAVAQEQVRGVEVECDGIFVAIVAQVRLRGRGDHLRHGRQHALEGTDGGHEGHAGVDAGSRHQPEISLVILGGGGHVLRIEAIGAGLCEGRYDQARGVDHLPLPIGIGRDVRLLGAEVEALARIGNGVVPLQ